MAYPTMLFQPNHHPQQGQQLQHRPYRKGKVGVTWAIARCNGCAGRHRSCVCHEQHRR